MVKRIEHRSGTIEYVNENGFYHREDGPALIYPNGKECWYLNGEPYLLKQWIQVVNISDEEKMELMLRYG